MKFLKKPQVKKTQKSSVFRISASKNTNGRSGGSMMEGRYFVYRIIFP